MTIEEGPVHAYVAVPGGKTCYLSELKAGNEVIVVDQKSKLRTAIVGQVMIETKPLILMEAKAIMANCFLLFLLLGADKGDSIRVSYVHHLTQLNGVSVVGEINRQITTNEIVHMWLILKHR